MSRRSWAVLVAVWLFSLVAVGAIAQSRVQTALPEPITLTGSDIAFRVEAVEGRRPVGKLIVRYNGQWVEPRAAAGTVTLASR
jgi:hypothetical protein